MLFVIGGNGSHAGANAIHEEVDTSILYFISSFVIYVGHVLLGHFRASLDDCIWLNSTESIT